MSGRRKKGEVRKEILDILEKGPLSYTEIDEELEERIGAVSDKVISQNLNKLKDEELIQRLELGGSVKWRLTESYSEYWANEAVEEVFGDRVPVHPGMPDREPKFDLSWCGHRTPAAEELDDAVRDHFRHHVNSTLLTSEDGERQKVAEFFARSAWVGCCLMVMLEKKRREERKATDRHGGEEEVPEASRGGKIWERLAPGIEDLESLLENKYIWPMGENDLVRFVILGNSFALVYGNCEWGEVEEMVDDGEVLISEPETDAGRRFFPPRVQGTDLSRVLEDRHSLPHYMHRLICRSLIKLLLESFADPELKAKQEVSRFAVDFKSGFGTETRAVLEDKIWDFWRSLDGIVGEVDEEPGAMVHLDSGDVREIVGRVSPDPEESFGWMRKNVEDVLPFLEKLNETKFAHLVGVGYPKLDSWTRSYAAKRDVELWLDIFEKGGYDDRDHIFTDMLRNVESVAYRLQSDREMDPEPVFLDFDLPTAKEIYNDYPRAKDPEWWEELADKIRRRREKREEG